MLKGTEKQITWAVEILKKLNKKYNTLLSYKKEFPQNRMVLKKFEGMKEMMNTINTEFSAARLIDYRGKINLLNCDSIFDFYSDLAEILG